MQIHNLTPKEWLKALGVGITTAILLSVVMVATETARSGLR